MKPFIMKPIEPGSSFRNMVNSKKLPQQQCWFVGKPPSAYLTLTRRQIHIGDYCTRKSICSIYAFSSPKRHHYHHVMNFLISVVMNRKRYQKRTKGLETIYGILFSIWYLSKEPSITINRTVYQNLTYQSSREQSYQLNL